MTKETLKQLIEVEYQRSNSTFQFKQEVLRLIDLYEQDKPFTPTPGFTLEELPYKDLNTNYYKMYYNTPPKSYFDLCSCNPKNGGSGVCGCVLGHPVTYCK